MAVFNLPADGERSIKLEGGSSFTALIDTRPFGKFEEIACAYREECEELLRKRDELLLEIAEKRGVNLAETIEALIEREGAEGRDSLTAIARAKMRLSLEWNAGLAARFELARRRFSRELCRWGIAGHRDIIINGEPLQFAQTKVEYEGRIYSVAAEETLDYYARIGALEPLADEVYATIFPGEAEKKS